MPKHTRDSTKERHDHTLDGDIVYTKDNFSVNDKKVISEAEKESKMVVN